IIPSKIEQPDKLNLIPKKHFPVAYKRLQKANKKSCHFIYVARRLTSQQLNILEQAQCPDIHYLQEPSRFCHHPSAGSIVGLVDIDGKGVCGIEWARNKQLAGSPTTKILQKDARSRNYYFKELESIEGKAPDPVYLTIDSQVQFLVQEELEAAASKWKAELAMAVVMDPKTGEIIAMAQNPTFDPNNTRTLNIGQTKHTVISDAYELGSVVKIFVALAALEEELVTPDEPINCQFTEEGRVHGRPVNTWRADGIIPFSEVIQASNNIGTVIVAFRLGKHLYDHYKRLGFSQPTGIELPGQQVGFVTAPERWSKQSLVSLAFGYEIRSSLLQLARAFSLFINGGKLIKPHVIQNDSLMMSNLAQPQLYSNRALQQMRQILRQTIESGTARRGRITGYTVMGKTGTANLVVNKKYSQEHNIYTFTGSIEQGDYARVIVVSIKNIVDNKEHLFASTVAVPLFRSIAEKLVVHDRIVSHKA
ncbi:penicillin-binding protein 2, partial [bacterium]|nr:penicillin-binding protein 2 [bacterium]